VKKQILALDYDRTLTLDDLKIPESTKETLKELRQRQIAILGIVSGRSSKFLRAVNEQSFGVFSFLVAENGAIIHLDHSSEEIVTGKDWALRARNLFNGSHFDVRFGEIMGAAPAENFEDIKNYVLEAGLKSNLVLNRDQVLLLPEGVDKGSGVSRAILNYGSRDQIELTSFGDAENDISLFQPADIKVAVGNAVDSLKKLADVVTEKYGGLGVEEYVRKKFMS
jgi:hydroxymethylpyrimidine pyrophosphatase-like HAD family hydrolase